MSGKNEWGIRFLNLQKPKKNLMKNTQLLVHRTDIFKTSIETQTLGPLSNGMVRLKIEKYALTTNNITYAVVGDQMQYWNFFPTELPWGIVPVWGYARVAASQHPEVAVGERYYGYFPMSDYLDVKPGKFNSGGFADVSEHRQALAPIYNSYSQCSKDPIYLPDQEDFIPIFRPLFSTAFLNYHFLKSENFFSATNIILTSASSKTALALASLLQQNQKEDGTKVIGLTSAANLEFVRSTGFYDEVLVYENMDQLPLQASTVVDMRGKGMLLLQIQNLLGDQLKYISLIGLTDWQAAQQRVDIPIATFFFAPTFAQKYFQEVGVATANAAIAKGLHHFIAQASTWLDLVYCADYPSVATLFSEMVNGAVDPKKGYIVTRG